jgi:hypothetical protein
MSGYIKDWNVDAIERQLWSMTCEATNPRHDGFTTWPIKQDLYALKWAIEDALEKCPTYSTEKEWVEEQEKIREQDKIIRILKS